MRGRRRRGAAPGRLMAALLIAAPLTTGACGDGGPLEPAERHPFHASGHVVTLNGSIPAGLRVTLRAGNSSSSAAVAADGSFTVEALLAGDSVDVIIDASAGPRSTLPALLRVSSRAPLAGASILLVPARWTINGGAFHGQTVNVSIDAAFRPPCANAGDANCDGFYPKAWFTGPKLWTPSALPAPVAFDHARSHQAIGAADSTQFWTLVQRMNDDAGMQLFRAARASEIATMPDGQPTAGILVRVDTTLAGFGAWTNWWWNASGLVVSGLVRPRTLSHLRNGPLMTHELLHAQGFKHSCSWTTVMSGYGNPCGSSTTLSMHDVAYLQLAHAINGRQRATGVQHALIAALNGERVVVLQLPPYGPAVLAAIGVDGVMHGDHAH